MAKIIKDDTRIMKNHIQKILDERNMRALELAKKLNLSPSQLSRFITGQRPLKLEWILRICKVLDVTANELVDLPKDMKLPAKCDEALMSSVIMWVMDACTKYKIKPTSKSISKWATYAYNEAVDAKLNLKKTRELAFTLVKTTKK